MPQRRNLARHPDTVSYLLPHEVGMVSSALVDLVSAHGSAVADAAEALAVCGDWGENGPVEAARDEANIKAAQAGPFAHALQNSMRVGYPDPESPNVEIGSYARIRLAGEKLGCMLVGMMAPYRNVELPEDPTVEDVMVTTHTSPMGAALLGKTSGDEFAFTGANGITLSGSVEEIDQGLMAQTYGAPEIVAPAA